jgi:hypothetical protein
MGYILGTIAFVIVYFVVSTLFCLAKDDDAFHWWCLPCWLNLIFVKAFRVCRTEKDLYTRINEEEKNYVKEWKEKEM